jgi:AraC-like DNA-binding protein
LLVTSRALEPVGDEWVIPPFRYCRLRNKGDVREEPAGVATLEIVLAGARTVDTQQGQYELKTGVAMFKPAETHSSSVGESDSLVVEIPASLALAGEVADHTARAWALNLSRELVTRRPGWERIVAGSTIEGLGHLERLAWESRSRPRWLDQAVDLAKSGRTLAEIASRLAKHPSHVAREFRRHEGVSVGEYARRCRLELASIRLRTTTESIAELAVSAGFCDQSHFTNAFHRLFGVTPAKYRGGFLQPNRAQQRIEVEAEPVASGPSSPSGRS